MTEYEREDSAVFLKVFGLVSKRGAIIRIGTRMGSGQELCQEFPFGLKLIPVRELRRDGKSVLGGWIGLEYKKFADNQA